MVQQIDLSGYEIGNILEPPVPFDANDVAIGTADTALVKTLPADPDRPNVLSQIHAGYTGTAGAGTLEIKDGSTVVWTMPINDVEPHEFNFHPPRCNAVKNTTLTVTLSAVSGATGYLALNARKHA